MYTGGLRQYIGVSGWSKICGDTWTLREASTVCKELGLGWALDASTSDFFSKDETATEDFIISGKFPCCQYKKV